MKIPRALHCSVLEAIRILNSLRYSDHQAARLKIQNERWAAEQAQRQKEAEASTQMETLWA